MVAGFGLPVLVVLRLAANVDHAVNRRGSTQPLASLPGLGLGLAATHGVVPAVLRAHHQLADALGHVDQEVAILAPGLEKEDADDMLWPGMNKYHRTATGGAQTLNTEMGG